MPKLPDLMSTGLMPARTVCLTFDDGPGPGTLPVADYLASQGIVATFFMCGKHVVEHRDVPPAVLALGHRIGNHSFRHTRLTGEPDDVIRAEMRSTLDLLVSSGVPLPVPFRPPYGDWDARCAAAVNSDEALVAAHAGVVGWDVDASDWDAWARGREDTAVVAGDYYLGIVGRRGGVVLMHDSIADAGEYGERARRGIRTVEVVAHLVPRLLAAGFTFAPLPPRVARATSIRRQWTGRVTAGAQRLLGTP